MVDFSKRLGKKKEKKRTDPFEIYDSLDRKSMTGPLRPVQETILREWTDNRSDDKDVVIKLHTGSGKTLIGLLIQLARINQNGKPCLYICPNIYLAQQVCLDAKKFGIPYCTIGADNQVPNSFIDGKKILITHAQKVFNGKSIFGLDKDFIECDSVILDDSHACIDAIKNAFTIRISRSHEMYRKILGLFEEDLINQGHGTFMEIVAGEYDSHLLVPYWSLIEKQEEILALLSKYKDDTDEVFFAWPLIKDYVTNLQIHISGNFIEFTPYHIPIERFNTFHRARQRILMSATTQDDSFFIRGLSFSKEAVLNPLEDKTRLWSGERMLLLPSLISHDLDRDLIVTKLAKPSKRPFGTVAITPSFKKAKQYESIGALLSNHDNIFSSVQRLKKGYFGETIVFANRYDGIDLPDEACRILIIDSKPYFNSLSDKYEESCKVHSDIINIKLAQRVEQGLGRSVRGEKDFSVVLLIGDDLVNFIKNSRTNKYFSAQTKKQIEIGLEIAEMGKEDLEAGDSAYKVIANLLNQAIKSRDKGWKDFYNEKMDEVEDDDRELNIYDILEKERKAYSYFYNQNPEKAAEIFQDIADTDCKKDNDEKGWYLQEMSRALYLYRKSESIKTQKAAFNLNNQLLKPSEGVIYKKVEFIDDSRTDKIINWINQYNSYDDMQLTVNGILSDLTFGSPAEKFEKALKNIGLALGFISERPDKEHKTGPDNLWCGSKNRYLIFECKSEVEDSRTEVTKSEVSQMNTHCGWFSDTYGDASVNRFLVIPTKDVSNLANFTHEVRIIRKGKLKALKSRIKCFFSEFQSIDIGTVSKDSINEFLTTHKLKMKDFQPEYSEAPYMKK